MASIRKTLFSGVFYTALARYSGIIISLVVTAILSRLLTPEDFGVIAIATVIINFFNIFTEIGLSPAIIQNKELSSKEISELFSFTVWTGIFISLLLTYFFHQPTSFLMLYFTKKKNLSILLGEVLLYK